MSTRLERIQELETTTFQYIVAEQTRINNEVSVLQAILNGRTGGAGIQQISKNQVASVAQNDLAGYLGK